MPDLVYVFGDRYQYHTHGGRADDPHPEPYDVTKCGLHIIEDGNTEYLPTRVMTLAQAGGEGRSACPGCFQDDTP